MLKDLIEIIPGFQSSVNIEYDFNDVNKISDFIPTSAAIEIITNIIKNTNADCTERAKILTGAYGRGKSYIILIALSLLYNKDKNLFRSLLDKVKNVDEESYKIINNYVTSSLRLLPVIINGNSDNLTQAFIGALQHALKLYELDDIMPETNFEAALLSIELWKNKYKDTYNKFVSIININVDSFINKLKANDVECYKKFLEIYPMLTSGSVFNPFVGFNVVDIYDKVNVSLKSKGFSGIYVVYDEFGKYLESSIAVATESETKMLQDFAEKCNRPSSQQLHLMLICHKDIDNYIDSNLSQDKVDGWRGISGRFEHLNLQNHFYQTYEIIASSIHKKNNLWNQYLTNNKKMFDELLLNCNKKNYLSGKDELVVYGCYPLHPATTFLLPRLSEKIAQNERTLFTYLTSNQKNTLQEYIKNNTDTFPIITPDCLFDYFELEFRKELSTSEIHKIYILSSKILAKIDKNSLSAKIIKTIAVIYFVQQFERLSPTIDTICSIFCCNYDRKEVIDNIDFLINEAYIIYLKNSNNYLCLKETSGIDINSELSKRSEQIKSAYTIEQALNLCVQNNYLYPTRHNETYCLTRYFELKFISFTHYKSLSGECVPSAVAGIVYAVFYENINEINQVKNIKNNHKRIVTIFPKKFNKIDKIIYKYLAALQLRNECVAEDEILKSEYDIIISDLESVVAKFVSEYLHPELNMAEFYYCNEKQNINRKSKLSELLSNICDLVYPFTPVINNESINKDFLPTVAINSRNKVVSAIIESTVIEKNLGLIGSGQDVSFMRSTLMQTHILKEQDGKFILDCNNASGTIQKVLDEIKDFFISTIKNGEQSFSVLYNHLTEPDYGIGMKKGSIPIYIAVVLHNMKKDLILKCNGNEVRINADALNSINEKPENYSVVMEDWNNDKSVYLSELSDLFSEYIIEKEKTFNSFNYIVSAMVRWYLSLPKCAKEMTSYYQTGIKIDDNKCQFILSLKRHITNSRDYLFDELPKIFDCNISNITGIIKETKNCFDNAKSDLIAAIIVQLKTDFYGASEKSLMSVMNEWYKTLKEHTIQNLFPNNEDKILSLIKNITNDEVIFAERIGKAMTGLRVDDWNNNILDKFNRSVRTFIETIEDFNTQDAVNPVGISKHYKIVVVDDDGNEQIKSFDKVQYSNRAKLLYQDITGAIEEIGQSVSEQEKRQILIEILESLC